MSNDRNILPFERQGLHRRYPLLDGATKRRDFLPVAADMLRQAVRNSRGEEALATLEAGGSLQQPTRQAGGAVLDSALKARPSAAEYRERDDMTAPARAATPAMPVYSSADGQVAITQTAPSLEVVPKEPASLLEEQALPHDAYIDQLAEDAAMPSQQPELSAADLARRKVMEAYQAEQGAGHAAA